MTAITLPKPAGEAAATQAVYTRTAWADAWSAAADLHCLRIAASTCETLSTAQFYYRFGSVIRSGQTSFSTKSVLTINPLTYVKVEITGTGGRAGFTWGGVFRSASKTDTHQTFSAVGLETLLDEPCRDAPYWDGSSVRWAGRGLRFNARGLPNRSGKKQTVNGVSVYVFEGQGLGEYWSTRDAVETLLALAAPKTAAGAVIFNWTPSNIAALPDFDRLNDEETHGTSFLALLRALVPRHRLVGFGVRLGALNTVEVAFDTFTATAISLTDASGSEVGTIPANSAQDTIICSADPSASVSLSIDGAAIVDQVIATGARRQVVCSLSKVDDTWDRKWNDTDRDAYIDAARDAADYPPETEPRERQDRDRQARAAEDLRHVFAHFGPGLMWTQTAGDGLGSVDSEDRVPLAREDQDDDESDQFLLFRPALEFLQALPLQTGYAYDGSKIANAIAEENPGEHRAEETSDQHEPLPTLVFARTVYKTNDEVDQWDSLDRWVLADQVARTSDLEQPDFATARRWSLATRPLPVDLAMECRVQGEAQHVIAAVEMGSDVDYLFGSLAWSVDLIVTVAIEDLRDTEVRYPADEDLVTYGELVRRLRIEAPQYRWVEVLPETVVGVDPTTQQLLHSDGGMVVDQREQLRLLAQRTYAWHRQPRYALSLFTVWIDGAFGIGHLITQITDATGTYSVNSVITEITLEFPVAQSAQTPRPSMTIATGFAEIDAARLAVV